MLSQNRLHPHPGLTSSVKMANFPLSSMSSSSSLVVVLPAVGESTPGSGFGPAWVPEVVGWGRDPGDHPSTGLGPGAPSTWRKGL